MRAGEHYIKTIISCGIMAGLCLAGSCRKAERQPTPVVRPVVTMSVRAAAERERRFSGTARAVSDTLLSFRVGGEIIELPVRTGRAVKAGDLIARLDPKDYELQLKQSQAQLKQAQAQFQQAWTEYERVRQQYEARIVSRSELEARQAVYHSAQAACDAAQKGCELAQQQLKYCELCAPLDGTIASVPVEAHQTVAAGQVVAALSVGGAMEMRLGLPEALVGKVKLDDLAGVVFDAVPEKRFSAQVSEIGIEPDAGGAYPVKLRLLESDERIRSGMVGEAVFSFAGSGAGDVIVVPAVAVVARPAGGHYVWVYQPDRGVVVERDVQIGALTSDGLQVTAGLESGAIIVIRGVHQLQSGMPVRLLPRREDAQ